MTFTAQDFRAIETFEFTWRWTSERHDLLPADVLCTIRPLTHEAAQRLAIVSRDYCAELPIVEYDLSIAAEDDARDSVRVVLQGLPISPDAEVVVSWSSDTAVVTTWATLARFWSAFFYPSSDNVSVWSPSDTWVLCYRHYQALQFRHRARVA